MDGTNHSSQTLQSLSPDKREGLEHELRPEALASIARAEQKRRQRLSKKAADESSLPHDSEKSPLTPRAA